MSIRSIELEEEGGHLPGSVVQGRVVGTQLAGEVRLFWSTCGRGTEEVGVVDRQKIPSDGKFKLTLPGSPYTTHGTLVSIEWGIEWVDDSGDALDRREIVVSPTGKAVRLDRVAKPRSKKPKSRWDKSS